MIHDFGPKAVIAEQHVAHAQNQNARVTERGKNIQVTKVTEVRE